MSLVSEDDLNQTLDNIAKHQQTFEKKDKKADKGDAVLLNMKPTYQNKIVKEAEINNKTQKTFLLSTFSDGNSLHNFRGIIQPNQIRVLSLTYDKKPYPRGVVRLQKSLNRNDRINLVLLQNSYRILGCKKPYTCKASYPNANKISFVISSTQ